jgi:propanol-preferring alcohol dehydrogenase
MTDTWEFPVTIPSGQVGGHEGVGRIVAFGPGTNASVLKEGDRVGIKWIHTACNTCEACLEGYDGVCFNRKISGYMTPGTFQQYVVAPANYVTPIPEGVDDASAAPMLCAGITTYAALKRSNARGGSWVVIMGAGGGLGHIAIQLAKGAFAHRVIGVDMSSKRDFVLSTGAEAFVAVDESKNIPEDIKKLTGGLGAHSVLVMTASDAAYADSLNMLRFGGTLVCVGIPEGDRKPIQSANAQLITTTALKIVGIAVGNRQEAIECLEFASRGIVKTAVSIRGMDELTQVFEEMHDRKLQGRVVLQLE